MKELPHTETCFVCGESNPVGMNLRFHDDGEAVRARFTPGVEHAGFKDVIHGGLLSTVLDECMVWACAARTLRFAYCAEMTVRFLRPTVPGTALDVCGRLMEDRRGRVYHARAELTDPAGVVCASATGKYIPIRDIEMEQLRSDLVGDWPPAPDS
jgi:acyl-coenzyme A thioesterase PaaI-like protein